MISDLFRASKKESEQTNTEVKYSHNNKLWNIKMKGTYKELGRLADPEQERHNNQMKYYECFKKLTKSRGKPAFILVAICSFPWPCGPKKVHLISH